MAKLVLALLALVAVAYAGTTTTAATTQASTADVTTTAETTTAETTTEEPLRCGFDRDLDDATGQNIFDAKMVRTKFDLTGDRDYGLKGCGKKADTDTNDFSFQWVAGKNDVYGIDTEGDCNTWVLVRDAEKCKGDTIVCDKDAVNIKAKKGNVYGIHIYGRSGENDYKCKFNLNIRRGCKLPYMTKSACEDKCYKKSVRHVTKKQLVYWPELVIDRACPKCLCHKVHVPYTTTAAPAPRTTTAEATTRKTTAAPTTTTTTTARPTTTTTTTTKRTTTTTTTARPTTTEEERRRRRRRRSSATTSAPVVCPSFRPCNCKEGSVNVSYYDDDGCEVDCACVVPPTSRP